MQMVNCTIDGKKVCVPEHTTILEAAKEIGVYIPTLCYFKGLNEIGACRVCVVEVEGDQRLHAACNSPVLEGMVVHTNSKKAREARKCNVELILSQHNVTCTTCVRSGNCALQHVANDLNIMGESFPKDLPKQKGSKSFPLIREYDKCIKCMRCIQVCDKIQATHVWDVINSGGKSTVDVRDFYRLEDSPCSLCGQCITHCPVGALRERDDTDKVLDALDDPETIVLAQIAPSIRTAWGEEFGLDAEEASVQRLASCLKEMGFDYVFDTDFAADLTIMEEASEFLHKLTHQEGDFPMFTSCCPGWVRFIKSHYPEYIPQVSTSKSPQQMFGAIAKSYYADILKVSPKKIFSVSIMPCLAKKAECSYPNMTDSEGNFDVDVALTTREVNRLIRAMHISPKKMKDVELDMPLGLGSGAGNIFGATGGVMEAALRSAYYLATGENPNPDAFKDVRGMDGWKESSFDIAGNKLKIAVVNGLANADRLLTALKKGQVYYDFVEVMACPGGCVGGGGQPIHDQKEMAAHRAPVLYKQDREGTLRFCHENPSIKLVYQDYLEKPLSERAEELLHTSQKGWLMPGESE